MVIRAAMIAPLLTLSACSGYSPNYDLLAKGPTTQFDGAALAAAAENQKAVVTNLSTMAGIDPIQGPVGSAQWKQFGIAALGRARLECNAYVTEIMKVEEHRRTINQQLAMTGAATAGILGVAGAASAAIAITAIAFGLVQGTVDNVTTGLLYSLGAEPVQAMIGNLRAAYTAQLTDDSWRDRATTFNTIYGYLELCTPVVLREKIKVAVATVPAQATKGDSQGGTPRVSLATQRIIEIQTLPNSNTQLPRPVAQPGIANGSALEQRLTPAYVRSIQTALCVEPATGNPGGLPGVSTPTRRAIQQFLAGRSRGAAMPGLEATDMALEPAANELSTGVTQAQAGGVVQSCASRGFVSAFEVGYFEGLSAGQRVDEIRRIQRNMNRALDRPVDTQVDGEMATMRTMAGLVRAKLPNLASDPANRIDQPLIARLRQVPDAE
jgi:hypothetical protein